MTKLFQVFTKPTTFFTESFPKISVNQLGVLYAGFLGFYLVTAIISGLLVEESIVSTIVSFLIGNLVPFLIFVGVMTVVPKLIIGSKNKEFSYMQALKVYLSAQFIAAVIQVITETLSLILIVLSGGFRNEVENLNPDAFGATPGAEGITVIGDEQLANLAGQGIFFGGLGIIVACLALFGLIWTVVVEYKGLKIVSKVDSGTALIATIVPYIIGLVLGALFGGLQIAASLL